MRRMVPGLALASSIALLAYAVQVMQRWFLDRIVVEALVVALLLGMIWRNMVGIRGSDAPGIGLAGKQMLEVAIVLLGATIDFPALLAAGPVLFGITAGTVFIGLITSLLIGRGVGLNSRLAILIAVGNSICGNSAIAAVAPIVRAQPEEVASSIALTAVVGACLVLGLPVLVRLLDLGDYQYGVLAGLTVYAVPQVLAATFPVSALSVQVGTLVKLGRVLFLGPVVMLFALSRRRALQTGRGGRVHLIPWFIGGFCVMGFLRSDGVLPMPLVEYLAKASQFLTILAMAALGLTVDARVVRRVGLSVATVVVLSLATLLTVSTALIHAFALG
jgi:uncharacterized integral membrane protein (TIGR00698 family)